VGKVDYNQWLGQKQAQECVNNLNKHGFKIQFFLNGTEARAYILKAISGYKSFGFGGSDTTRKLDIIDTLKQQKKVVYDHCRYQQADNGYTDSTSTGEKCRRSHEGKKPRHADTLCRNRYLHRLQFSPADLPYHDNSASKTNAHGYYRDYHQRSTRLLKGHMR